MSDEEQSFDEGLTAEDDLTAGKVGFLPAAIIRILKWAALAIGAIIFIVTVVFITMRFITKGTQTQSYVAVAEGYEAKTPTYDWYDNIPEIRGRTADQAPTTYIIKVNLGYDQGDKEVQSELIARTPRMRDMLRNYFSKKTAEELKNEDRMKAEIKEMVNRILSNGQVREVIFLDLNVVEF